MAHERTRYDTLLQVCAPECLITAVDQAAHKQFTTRSGYVRTAVLDRLRADGIDPGDQNKRSLSQASEV
jgi:hypothetical protein